MALEDLTGTKYIDDLNSSNPAAGDNVSEGDDHIRGIKNVLKTTFPGIDGAITATDTELNYVDGVTSAVQTQLDAITANDWVTAARMADNSVNSDMYVDGSIDTAHLADGAITAAKIADGTVVEAEIADNAVTTAKINTAAVTSAKIANDNIDSQHYAADSIDTEHYAAGSVDATALASNAVTEAKINSGAVTNAKLGADAVTGAKIADDAINEARLEVSNAGSNGQFLAKQSGNTGGLTWTTVVSEDYIPDGSVMAFFQANAPTGWTKVTTQNDKMLRVVSGTGGGTGGSAAVSSPAHNISAAAHTLATSEMPSHTHGGVGTSLGTTNMRSGGNGNWYYLGTSLSTGNTGSAGSGGSHSHNTSGSITTPQYIDVIICSKDA
jgi:hypothetical protein